MRSAILILAAFATSLTFAQPAPAPAKPQETLAEFIKANYTKYEHEIPMRDGKKLYTSVYVPKDASEKWPILLNRTPYSVAPYGVDNYPPRLGPSEKYVREKFIFVSQDVRGRNMSEGEFVNVRPHNPNKRTSQDIDEASDTYDTIDWLVKNVPNNNGRVGIYGISYPGFYSTAGCIDAHPALKACSPQAPVTDWFIGDDFHHNGALYLPHMFRFFSFFGRPRPEPARPEPREFARAMNPQGTDGYRFFLELGSLTNVNEKFFKNEIAFWNEMIRHPNYDEWWQARNIRNFVRNIKPAVMTVGGWFDAENLFGALRTYEAIEKLNPGAQNMLVMGPWYHGQWSGDDGEKLGQVSFNAKTSVYYREQIEFPFFNYYLKGKGELKHPEAWVFETGTNQWRQYDTWPPASAAPRTLYLRANGKLSWDAPGEENAFDEYVSDPARPVPYINAQAPGMTREHMVDDQRFASTRTDVLTYESDVLAKDVTVAGVLRATLFVSTSGTDSDFVVKLIDVYPDDFPEPGPGPNGNPNQAWTRMAGYQQLVRGEVFRGRYRNSFSNPEPFTPGRMEKIEYDLPDIHHTFRRGHRIMIQIQSSWFPLVDRNPQKFVDIYSAKSSDFQKATQRVFRSRAAASSLRLLVMP
jgi:putative CocE/NonD family hydrolase